MYRRFFTNHIRLILTVSIAVQCCCVMIFLYSYSRLQVIAERNIMQFADRFVEKVTDDLNRNTTYMGQTILGSSDYRTMFQQSDLAFIGRISDLQVTYKLLSEFSENNYNFFAYDKESGKFLELTTVRMQFSEYRRIKPEIIELITNQNNRNVWHLMELENAKIIVGGYCYGDFVIGAWIDEDSFLAGMDMLDYGSNGSIGLFYLDQEMFEPEITRRAQSAVIRYGLEKCSTDFGIQIVLNYDSRMRQIMIIQMLQFMLALQIMIVLMILIWQIRKNLIIPVRNLTEVLAKYESVMEIQEGGEEKPGMLTAVDDAYVILDKLGQRVERLNVALYESELEKKQLQLNFRNLQIRPHFLVNCLAMISGMAQLNDVEKIQEMTVCLSEYYRYVLHDCMDMVPLSEEIEHMKNVMRLNQEWNSNRLHFTCQIEEELKDLKIPVLLIGTFLENSIKHSAGADGVLEMSFTAQNAGTKEEEAYLKITDNGEGFPEEMTDRLNRGELTEEAGGKHIGINNVLQRLSLIYNGRAKILFSRGEEGGACVEIWVPKEVSVK